jgi:hypothetical protein
VEASAASSSAVDAQNAEARLKRWREWLGTTCRYRRQWIVREQRRSTVSVGGPRSPYMCREGGSCWDGWRGRAEESEDLWLVRVGRSGRGDQPPPAAGWREARRGVGRDAVEGNMGCECAAVWAM